MLNSLLLLFQDSLRDRWSVNRLFVLLETAYPAESMTPARLCLGQPVSDVPDKHPSVPCRLATAIFARLDDAPDNLTTRHLAVCGGDRWDCVVQRVLDQRI